MVDASKALVGCLRRSWKCSYYPALRRLWLLDKQVPEPFDPLLYCSYNRRDLIAFKTWVMPYDTIPDRTETVFVRMPDGREVLSNYWTIIALAEGGTWKETLQGFRFPAGWLSSDGFHGLWLKPLPVISAQAYRARFPQSRCWLWENEKKTGQQLLEAMERDGLMDASPLSERTPPGWRRDSKAEIVPQVAEEDTAV